MGVHVQLTEAGGTRLSTQGQSTCWIPTVRDMTFTLAGGQHLANWLAMSQQGVAS
jgi:hypothetical protein